MHWQLVQETIIKAKSTTGYRTTAPKVTQNKFQEEEPKPELTDDWDQRLIVTTLRREEEGRKLTLEQEADRAMVSQATTFATFSGSKKKTFSNTRNRSSSHIVTGCFKKLGVFLYNKL